MDISYFSLLQDGPKILRCNFHGPIHCNNCESCLLVEKIKLSKAWFTPLSYNSKRLFLERLVFLSGDFIDKMHEIFSSLQSKDYEYSISRLKHGSEEYANKVEESSNHSLDIFEVENTINEQYISWFVSSSEWAKKIFLLSLLKLCTIHVIKSIQQVVSKAVIELNTVSSSNEENNRIRMYYHAPETTNKSKLRFSKSEENFQVMKCQSAPVSLTKSAIKSSTPKFTRRYFSARERITSKVFVVVDDCEQFNKPSFSSPLSKNPSKTVFMKRVNSAARCRPFLRRVKNNHANEVTVDFESVCSMGRTDRKDFIRCLPIQISKKIFGFLTEDELSEAAHVCQHWKYLADQVMSETVLGQITREDVMIMQPSNAKVPHSCYARRVPVHVPKLGREEQVINNMEATHVDVENLKNEFFDINMADCYEGIETHKVVLEERNIFCSSYNVLIFDSRKDTHRQVHADEGNYIVSGSTDRKVHVCDIRTTEEIRTIKGHSGSVKCVLVDEKKGMVVSGGYDTTVRVWDLKSGKCMTIFRGHKGSVITLSAHGDLIASSSSDNYIKVWNLATGKCKRTFHNTSVARAVKIVQGLVLAGYIDGMVNLWDIETSTIKKTFQGHSESVTCVNIQQWHIITGSMDGFVMLWSNVGNLEYCLKSYRHPQAVLCLEVLYCRIITGCADGKVRVWNLLNGECLRMIRGNSNNEAITSLFTTEYRLVVNTSSCVLIYYFERMHWDYRASRYQMDRTKNVRQEKSSKPNHSFSRAVRLHYGGSPIHKNRTLVQNVSSGSRRCSSSKLNISLSSPFSPTASLFHGYKEESVKSQNISRCSSSISQHISRIQSAKFNSPSNTEVQNKDFTAILRNTENNQHNQTIYPRKNKHDVGDLLISNKNPQGKGKIQTRCRSAPVRRMISLPAGSRGVSTSGESLKDFSSNIRKMVFKPGFKIKIENNNNISAPNPTDDKIKYKKRNPVY